MADNNVNYFEPNDSDFNVEDLCIGVKLEVSAPGRAITASAGDNNISWQTILDDVNLLGGTDGYLSTSYSDISSLDAHNGGNKDSFGIEYINIHYNSWNFPEVDMKLVDVRGNAVMNPLESRRDDNDKAGSFLNALFTFPYPMFRLTVKGYYGRPVMYKLTVRDVRTNFNATNGNFEITVKFIGYMFGYLNDIPMQYLLIAPDIDYGGEVSLGNFSDEDGHAIPTFTEFLKSITDAIQMMSTDNEIGDIRSNARRLRRAIGQFEDILDIVERINDNLTNVYTSVWKDIIRDGNTPYNVSANIKEDADTDELKRIQQDLYRDFKSIEDTYNLFIEENDIDAAHKVAALDDFLLHNNDYGSSIREFGEEPDTLVGNPLFNFYYDELKSGIEGKLGELKGDLNDTEEQLSGRMGRGYNITLGWDPTVGNIFEMVFAHFKCFYTKYRKCIENIRTTSSSRNSSSLGISSDYLSSGPITVPPFPLVTKKTNKKYEWIGEVTEMNGKYQEIPFIEGIISGATSTGEELAQIAVEYDMERDFMNFPQKGIPTLLSDLYHGAAEGNPYRGTSYSRDGDTDIPTVLKTFAKRLLLRYVFNSGDAAELSYENFAKLEALNCYREHLELESLDTLTSLDCWTEAGCNMTVMDYIKTGFTQTTHQYYDLSIYYGDYKNAETIDEGFEEPIITLQSSTFQEGASEIADYEDILYPVYEYLNGNQGAISATYGKVFPLTIPLEFGDVCTDLFDNVVNSAEEVLGQKINGSWYELNADDFPIGASERALINEGSFTYYEDIFQYYKRKNPDPADTTWTDEYILQEFLVNVKALTRPSMEYEGGAYTYEHLDNDIKNRLKKYGVLKIPKVFFLSHYCTDIFGDYSGLEYYTEYITNHVDKTSYLEKIKEIFEYSRSLGSDSNREVYGSYSFTILDDNIISKINEILSETVTIYSLHGGYRLYDDDTTLTEAVGTAGNVFAKTLLELYGGLNETRYRIATQRREYSSVDKKISIYMTMKELYDRWKFGTWSPNNASGSEQSLMVGINNFVFLDSQYEDIKQKHYINFDVFADLVRNIVDAAKEMSVYSFLYEICKAANMTLHALPINVYDYLGRDDTNKLQEMFTTYPFIACEDEAMQTTYVAMYSHKPSEHLNIVDPYNSYEDDGIDFTSNSTVINSNKPLPVFGVTYGMQKQRFFKNISVGSDNPKTTAHSLMSELLISKQATSGSQNLGFEAHDIFDVYATKSYTCRVEMMGNAMIMPMMYFQLNNIPMFKGGYFIINAEHNISRNGMTTTFTGVRVNKNRFDLLPKNVVDIQTYIEGGRSGVIHDDDDRPFQREFADAIVPNSYDISRYNSGTTKIILDAGHHMARSGKESPEFEVHDLSSRGVTGDTDGAPNYGSLRPLTINAEEVFQEGAGTGGEGKTRYREYWGNRKIVKEIESQLRARGIPPENIIIHSTTGRTAPSYESLHGDNTYSRTVNDIYTANDGNCIVVSIHSNAVDGEFKSTTGANLWEIYCQNNREFIKDLGIRENFDSGPLPNENESYYLAKCIKEAMDETFSGSALQQFNPNSNTYIRGKIRVFKKTEEGIRPLTYCKPPTVLSENFFHSSIYGVSIIGTKEGVRLIAKAHVDGILRFLNE